MHLAEHSVMYFLHLRTVEILTLLHAAVLTGGLYCNWLQQILLRWSNQGWWYG